MHTRNSSSSSRIQARSEWLLIALFLVAISLPGLRNSLGPEQNPTRAEMRQRTAWSDVVEALEEPWRVHEVLRSFVGDNFGFRSVLVRWHGIAKVMWLGVSSSEKVLLGREGWAFLDMDGAVESYQAMDPYSPQELRELGRLFENRRRWLAERDIRYLLVAAPDKHSIYPEYLPERVKRVGRRTRLDQLGRYLRRNTAVEFLDLQSALRSAKLENRVYFRLDTHWNAMGAYVAYRTIIERLSEWFPELEPTPISDFDVQQIEAHPMTLGLASMLGLSGALQEEIPHLTPRFVPRAVGAMSGKPLRGAPPVSLWGHMRTRAPGAAGPKLFVLRDSFASSLVPFLSEHFPTVHYAWPEPLGFNEKHGALIEKERPELVIQEFVERILQQPVKHFSGKGR